MIKSMKFFRSISHNNDSGKIPEIVFIILEIIDEPPMIKFDLLIPANRLFSPPARITPEIFTAFRNHHLYIREL